MSYVVSNKEEREAMLKEVGVSSYKELFKDVPDKVILKKDLNIEKSLDEFSVYNQMKELAGKNKVYPVTFRGFGTYRHLIPEVVKHLSSIHGFVTSYTPYQAEISQGILQAIFEYQSEMCFLTDLDVSNASIYDGASAAAEAMIMCMSKKKNTFLLSPLVHPNTIKVIKTYAYARDINIKMLKEKDGRTLLNEEDFNTDVAGLLVQSPNCYGVIEDLEKMAEITHSKDALIAASVNPISLSLLKTPGEANVDIACGEGQSLGLSLGFGGPYLGFITAKDALMRKIPGRIVGESVDSQGKRIFVLTLQAREQHIRREKATSSICSNQALCALRASIYLSALGPVGLKRVAELSYNNAHYLFENIIKIKGFKAVNKSPFFNEFVIESEKDLKNINKKLSKIGIQGPYLLSKDRFLIAATEANTKEQMDMLLDVLREAK